jgi:hypothetical protein
LLRSRNGARDPEDQLGGELSPSSCRSAVQLRGPRSAQKRKIALHGAQRDRKPGRGRHSLRRFFLGAAPMTEEQKQQRIVELEGRTNATAGGDRRRRTVDRDARGSRAAIWCLLDAPERSDSLIGLVGAPFIATPCRSGSPAAPAPYSSGARRYFHPRTCRTSCEGGTTAPRSRPDSSTRRSAPCDGRHR